jgi:hypothetical protein
MDTDAEMVEGALQVKSSSDGWRHYVETPDGKQRDIRCGSKMEVKLDGDALGGWLAGHYEGRLTDPIIAHLVIGEMSEGSEAWIMVPIGAVVRIRK